MDALRRIIDANANRAREALRVLEDLARFGLNNASLAGDLKAARHAFTAAMSQPSLDPALLLAARDAADDVGQSIKTDAELARTGLSDTAGAAGSRLGEALRSIEESVKGLGGNARAFEQIRYESYRLTQRLIEALPTGRCPQWTLCILITESLCRLPWQQVAAAAIDAGADCLQLREKSLTDQDLLARARTLRSMTAAKASFIMNDRVDLALASDADGVHLGQTDLTPIQARRIGGKRLLIGCSTSRLEEARAAEGADYCGVGPMFPTTTKHKPVLAGPEYLRAYLAEPAPRPHLAIGGINLQNIATLREAGCRGVAVSSVVCSAADPAAVCRDLIAGLRSGQSTPDGPRR